MKLIRHAVQRRNDHRDDTPPTRAQWRPEAARLPEPERNRQDPVGERVLELVDARPRQVLGWLV